MTPADHDRARFVSAVAARLGLRVDPERSAEVIERRAAHHREPIAAYLARLDAADPPELRALATELTVGETYFFRHIEQYRAFADLAVPDRMTRGRLRVLSAGCSSGEEAYTLAMVLREAHAREAFEIRAIDVNPAAIARARAGRYSRWSLRATTPACEQRWFQTSGRDVVVAPELRAAVTFDQANLLDDGELATAERWDIVFCRNVIMYFTDDRADALIARIARSLVPGGYLFLGHAETLRGRTDDFALCHTHGAFYYQRYPATIAISAGVLAMPAMNGGHAELSAGPLDARWVDEIRAATQRVHAMIDVALDQVPGPEPLPAQSPVDSTTVPVSNPAVDLGEIRELLDQERFAEALARLDRLRAISGDPDVAMLRALALVHAGRFADARAACDELLAISSTGAGASYVLALCCDSTGDIAGAARQATLAAELDPSFAMPRVHLGLLARRLGHRELAVRELTRAIALLEREAPARLALYGGGFSRQALLGMCHAELATISAAGATR